MADAAPAALASGQAASSTLTLQETIARALQDSPALRKAEDELQSSRNAKWQSWAEVGPRASADYSEVHFDDAQTALMGPQTITLRPKVTKDGSITVAQPLTGAVALGAKASLSGVQQEMKENALGLTKSDVAFQAAETYIKAFQADQQLQVTLASITAVQEQLKDAEALERVGRLSHADTLKLQLAVSQAKVQAAQARAAREVATAALREALGLPPGAPLALAAALPKISTTVPELDQAIKIAETKRTEPTQAKLGVDAAKFGKDLAYAEFVPSVNAFVKWDRNLGELAGLGAERDTRSYGLSAQWDIWGNGSRVFAVRSAAATVQAAEESTRLVRQQIRLDVTQALANLAAARESLGLAKVAVAQAEEAYRIEKARFATGQRSATDLVLAESSLTGARGQLVTARADLVSWQLKMQRALGGELPQI